VHWGIVRLFVVQKLPNAVERCAKLATKLTYLSVESLAQFAQFGMHLGHFGRSGVFVVVHNAAEVRNRPLEVLLLPGRLNYLDSKARRSTWLE
jgi:hypothetical protein